MNHPDSDQQNFPRMSATANQLEPYKVEFIEKAIDNGVLLFGDFTLKSGR